MVWANKELNFGYIVPCHSWAGPDKTSLTDWLIQRPFEIMIVLRKITLQPRCTIYNFCSISQSHCGSYNQYAVTCAWLDLLSFFSPHTTKRSEMKGLQSPKQAYNGEYMLKAMCWHHQPQAHSELRVTSVLHEQPVYSPLCSFLFPVILSSLINVNTNVNSVLLIIPTAGWAFQRLGKWGKGKHNRGQVISHLVTALFDDQVASPNCGP